MDERIKTGPGLLADLEDLERRMLEAQEAVNASTATADAADGLVEATVSGRGELRELFLDARVYRELGPEELAAEIVAAVATARELALEEAMTAYTTALPDRPGPRGDDLEFGPLLSEVGQAGNRRPGGVR
ncbi:YbaB/EbfC family nucleoid-associated protein [Kribbella sp. NPDC020789]